MFNLPRPLLLRGLPMIYPSIALPSNRPLPTRGLFGLPLFLATDFEFNDDGCNWDITAEWVVFPQISGRFPRLRLNGRRPFCTPPLKPMPPPILPSNLPPPMGRIPYPLEGECSDPDTCIIWFPQQHSDTRYDFDNDGNQVITSYRYHEMKLLDVEFPYIVGDKKACRLTFSFPKRIILSNYNWATNSFNSVIDTSVPPQSIVIIPGQNDVPNSFMEDRLFLNNTQNNGYRYSFAYLLSLGFAPQLWIGNNARQMHNLGDRSITQWSSSIFFNYPISTRWDDAGQADYWTRFFKACYSSNQISPPPPPPKKDDDDMSCCAQLRQLLMILINRVGSLPADVPSSFLTKNSVQPNSTRTVNSLTELIGWFAERMDEVLGEFEINIEVEDIDPSKPGNQKADLRLPNVAESLAEIMTMLIELTITNNLLMSVSTRNLIESGQIKQIGVKADSKTEALLDMMGYQISESSVNMPLTFDPGALTIEGLLKEKEIPVTTTQYNGKQSIEAEQQALLQAAAIIRAVYFRRLPEDKKQASAQLLQDLKDLGGDKNKLKKDLADYVSKINKELDK